MAQVSMTSATQLENIIDLTNDENDQAEIEASNWEARMAKLVGFVEEFDKVDEEYSPVDDEAAEDLATLESSLSPSPEVSTEQPLSANPFAKLAFVGTGTLAIVLLAGAFLSQMMSGSNQKSTNNIVAPEVRSQPEEESQPQALAVEIETLKTKLALTEQAEDVKAAQQKLRTDRIIPPARLVSQSTPQFTPSVASRNTPVPQERVPTPVQTVYVPRTVTVERIVKAPSTPPVPPQLPIVKPESQPSVMMTPQPTPNPLEEWSRLAKLGSYGQVMVTERPNINQTAAQPESNPGMEQQASNPSSNPTPGNSIISQAQQQGTKTLGVGTSAKAVLATAVFGETTRSSNSNNDNTENKNFFVVRLKEPLKTANGAIAIPANTEFLTEINSLSEQGLIQLNVVKLISQNNGNLIEQNLPTNALVIRGSQGKPLIANQFPNQSSSIAGMDLGLFVLGGLGKAAELFNRSDSQVVTTTTSGTIINNTNPQRNVFAGILEGGMNTVVPLVSQRNQQAISQMMQRTNVWFMPAGTEVVIYVNQLMQI